MNNFIKYLLGASVLICIVLAVLLAYRGNQIEAQARTIAEQATQLERYAKDKAAQEVADNQLQAEKERIAKERNKYKKDLENALKDNPCSNTQLPDDAKRVLKELYGGKGS